MKNKIKNVVEILNNNATIVSFFVFFPFIYKIWLPDGSSIYFLDAIKNKWKLLSFIVVVLIFFIKKRKPSKLLIISTIMSLWTLGTTIINNPQGIKDTVFFVIAIITISGLIEIYIDRLIEMINGLMFTFELFLYPNLITVLLYRSTKGYLICHYLLGYYNTMMVFCYPAIALAVIYLFKTKKHVRPIALITVSVLTIVLARGSTPFGALLGTFGTVILAIVLKKFNIRTKHFSVFLYIFAFLFCVFILFFFVGGKFTLLDFVIEKVLNRSTNFTDRLVIWQKAEEMFLASPIFGHGRETLISASNGFTAIHAHNEYLSILVFTGAIGFVLFMIFNIMLVNKLDKSEDNLLKYIFAGLLFGIFISYVTECYQKEYMFYIVFFLAYHLDKILLKKENNNDITK